MEFLVWMLPGALIGWTASLLLRRENPREMLVNVAIGVAGAAFGSWLLGPMLGAPGMTAGAVGAANVQMAVLGAILTLAAVNLFVPARALHVRQVRVSPGLPAARRSRGEHAARG